MRNNILFIFTHYYVPMMISENQITQPGLFPVNMYHELRY